MPSLEVMRRILDEHGEGQGWTDAQVQALADRASQHAMVILDTFAHHRTAIEHEYRSRTQAAQEE